MQEDLGGNPMPLERPHRSKVKLIGTYAVV